MDGFTTVEKERLLAAIYPTRLEHLLERVTMGCYQRAEYLAGFSDELAELHAEMVDVGMIEDLRDTDAWPPLSRLWDAIGNLSGDVLVWLANHRVDRGRWLGKGTWIRGRRP